MYILSGCNGSGKTTASYSLLPELLECSEFVNSDEFAKSLSPFNPEGAYVMASRLMLLKTRVLFDQRKDFSIETTLATRSLLKMVRSAQEMGYYVTVLFFWLESADMAVDRVAARVASGGHYIPEETIRRRYFVGLKYFFRDYAPICDRWILCDNSHPPFREVAEGNRRSMIIRDSALYGRIRSLADNIIEPPPRRRETFVPDNVGLPVQAKDGVPARLSFPQGADDDFPYNPKNLP